MLTVLGWLLLRVALGAVAALIALRPEPIPASAGVFRDGARFVKYTRGKGRRVLRTQTGLRLGRAMSFSLRKETWVDRLAKTLSLAEEFTTGDRLFDDRVYIAADDRTVRAALGDDRHARAAVMKLLDAGFDQVYANRFILWASRRDDQEANEYELGYLDTIRNAINAEDARGFPGLPDPFADRIRWLNAGVFAVYPFALAGVAVSAMTSTAQFLDGSALFGPTVTMGGALLCGLVAGLRFYASGSARGHRVIARHAIPLLFGLPALAFALTADLDRLLDPSSTLTARPIARHEAIVTHDSKGRDHVTYYVVLGPRDAADPVGLPTTIRVDRDLYTQATTGGTLTAEVGKGAFGVAWYRSIVVSS